jgi:hypothetical protein
MDRNRKHLARGASFQPRIETLEDRCLLSATGQGDAVIRWNNVALNAEVVDLTPGAGVPGAGLAANPGPVRAARALAIVQAAIYDAVNSIDGTYEPYLVQTRAPGDASLNAAIAQAGHDTLVALYPAQSASFDLDLANDLAAIPDGTSKTEGIQAGATAAATILAARANDGNATDPPYTPNTNPGYWQPDPLHPTQKAYAPGYGSVTPFAIDSPLEFQAPPPPPLNSPQYAAAFQEVKTLGGDGVHTPTTRTPDQTNVGLFWSYDGSAGIGVPPRLYNQIAQVIAEQENNTEVQNARLFFLVNAAMADAGIVAWYTKYTDNYWRPITAIRDTSPTNGGDPNWMPLGATADNPQLAGKAMMPTNFTPPFPAYTSGHATFGAALFQTLTDFYGTDNVTFTFTSDELNGKTIGVDANGNPYVRPLIPMTFTSFSQAAYQNAESRIYLGIHWAFDRDQGLLEGKGVGNAVFNTQANFAQSPDDTFDNAVYRSMFNRRIDPVGQAFMTNMRGQGLTNTQMVQELTGSQEFFTNEVEQAFQTFLHRSADPLGLGYFTSLLAQGATIEQVDAAILGSAEYNASLSNGDFLTAVYRDVLGRSVDSLGQQYWSDLLAQGVSRTQVALQILQSTECRQDLVQTDFQALLGRSADSLGMSYFVGQLQSGKTQQDVIAGILGSTEYYQRVTLR